MVWGVLSRLWRAKRAGAQSATLGDPRWKVWDFFWFGLLVFVAREAQRGLMAVFDFVGVCGVRRATTVKMDPSPGPGP